MSKSNRTASVVGLLIALVILFFFTIHAFFLPKECDLDKIYLWCRLHPMTVFDVVGLVLFYTGALCIAGVTNLLGLQLTGEEGSIGKWPFIFGASTLLGIILFWNL